jgi:outer membrane protein, heavy metal efflux system
MAITVLSLSAEVVQKFDTFLQTALKTSPYLHSLSVDIERASQEGTLLQRYKNPNLELEVSRFSPDVGASENGQRVAILQPVRLWGVGDDKKQLANAIGDSAINTYVQKRAAFIKNISLLYVGYTQLKKFLTLAEQTSSIAKTIYAISSARYEAGTISRGEMLQAKIDYDTVAVELDSFKLNAQNSLYEIMQYGGVEEAVSLEDSYNFKVVQTSKETNPDIAKITAKKKEALTNASLNSNKVEWLDVFAEYEKEPAQKIARVGVNIPLALFNTKSEERQLALLSSKKVDLQIKNATIKLNAEIKRLHKERVLLHSMQSKNQKLLRDEEELLEMFQKAYKIANINLLALQDIKNRVIKSQKALIQINTALNKNAIYMNYLQGHYND